MHVVQHDAPDSPARGLELGLRALEHQTTYLARLVHEDDTVDLRGDDRGVGDRQHRRRVDEDHIVLAAHLAQELAHRGRGQQLRGIGRDRPGLDDVQVVEARRGHDVFHLEAAHEDVGHRADAVAPARVADEDVAQARLALDAEEAMDARPAKVAAEQERALAVLGHRQREVDDGGGLALLERGAGDDQHPPLLLSQRELYLRAQAAVRLGHRRLRVEVRGEEGVAMERFGLHVGQGRPPLDETLHHLPGLDVRHDAEHRHPEIVLDVLDGADRGVERFLDEGQDQAEHEPEQAADEDGVQRLAADGRPGLDRRADEHHLLEALGLLDERLLVAGLEQREEVLVDLGVALQARQPELDRGYLAVALLQLAHLAVEKVLAAPQQRDLGADLAPHLGPHLAHAVVEGLQSRMTVGHLERQVVALEHQLDLGGLQPLQGGVRRVHEDAIAENRVVARQPLLGQLQLRALLARLLDVAAQLREHREQHRRLGARRDDAVGLAVGPDLFLRPLDAALDLAELALDELPGLADASDARGPVVVAVRLGHRVGEVARLERVRRGRDDLEDAGRRHPRRAELPGDGVERRRVRPGGADGLAPPGIRQPAHAAGDLLDDRIALDETRLRLDRVRGVVRQHLDQQARWRRRLLELHRGRRLVHGHFLPREPEAEEHDQERRGDDDEPSPTDDQPGVAEVHLVLGHQRPPSAAGPVMYRNGVSDRSTVLAGDAGGAPRASWICTRGRSGWSRFTAITRPTSPVFRRTSVPGGKTEISVSSALMSSAGNDSRFERTISRTASWGRSPGRSEAGEVRPVYVSTSPRIFASSRMASPGRRWG